MRMLLMLGVVLVEGWVVMLWPLLLLLLLREVLMLRMVRWPSGVAIKVLLLTRNSRLV